MRASRARSATMLTAIPTASVRRAIPTNERRWTVRKMSERQARAKPFRIRTSSLGRYYDFTLPSWATVIIVAVNDGSGLKPISLLLPHQFYFETLREILK